MGGYESGFQGVARRDTDGLPRLDVRWLARRGVIAPGASTYDVVTWSRGAHKLAEIGVRYDDRAARVELSYEVGGQAGEPARSVREPVRVVRTPCRLGGARPWFACPGCGGRCAVLWLVGGVFRCRRCHDLAYASTREGDLDRALRRVERMKEKLRLPSDFPLLLAGSPGKPPRMHEATYARLAAELVAVLRRTDREFEISHIRLMARSEKLLADRRRELERLGRR